MNDPHWTYSTRPEDENSTCKGCKTREDAIEDGFGEEYPTESPDDVIYVSPCRCATPELPGLDTEHLLDNYLDTNNDEIYEGFADNLFQQGRRWELKPEVYTEFEQAIAPHRDAMKKAFLEVLIKHCGEVHQQGKEETIIRSEWKP